MFGSSTRIALESNMPRSIRSLILLLLALASLMASILTSNPSVAQASSSYRASEYDFLAACGRQMKKQKIDWMRLRLAVAHGRGIAQMANVDVCQIYALAKSMPTASASDYTEEEMVLWQEILADARTLLHGLLYEERADFREKVKKMAQRFKKASSLANVRNH